MVWGLICVQSFTKLTDRIFFSPFLNTQSSKQNRTHELELSFLPHDRGLVGWDIVALAIVAWGGLETLCSFGDLAELAFGSLMILDFYTLMIFYLCNVVLLLTLLYLF